MQEIPLQIVYGLSPQGHFNTINYHSHIPKIIIHRIGESELDRCCDLCIRSKRTIVIVRSIHHPLPSIHWCRLQSHLYPPVIPPHLQRASAVRFKICIGLIPVRREFDRPGFRPGFRHRCRQTLPHWPVPVNHICLKCTYYITLCAPCKPNRFYSIIIKTSQCVILMKEIS